MQKWIPCSVVLIALTACNAQRSDTDNSHANAVAEKPTAGTAAPDRGQNATQSISEQGTAPMQTVDSFVPKGMKIVETIRGDLTGAGRSDALVVMSAPASENEKPGEGSPRIVLLLTQDASGSLRKAAENRRIVPCERCGGLAGDPYAFSRIENGRFAISISGGSRQRWSAEYVFEYSAQSNEWYLQKAERSAYDQISEESISKIFTPKDFGQVSFVDFDPSIIQEVVLP